MKVVRSAIRQRINTYAKRWTEDKKKNRHFKVTLAKLRKV